KGVRICYGKDPAYWKTYPFFGRTKVTWTVFAGKRGRFFALFSISVVSLVMHERVIFSLILPLN
ncbi:MAG: hypothetical protein JXA13_16200, partial [Anaerolineales bacterium]|nr:hypothetical protein [Anaerolineales bacterium]